MEEPDELLEWLVPSARPRSISRPAPPANVVVAAVEGYLPDLEMVDAAITRDTVSLGNQVEQRASSLVKARCAKKVKAATRRESQLQDTIAPMKLGLAVARYINPSLSKVAGVATMSPQQIAVLDMFLACKSTVRGGVIGVASRKG